MSHVPRNTDGKTPFMCSCGIRVNLEPHEFPDWHVRHSTHYSGQEHKLQQIVEMSPESIQEKTLTVLNELSKRLQLEDKNKDVKK